jgi:hypothetical protein
MPQKWNDESEHGVSPVPQDQDDELEMAEDDEDFDDDDLEDDEADEDEGVEEA